MRNSFISNEYGSIYYGDDWYGYYGDSARPLRELNQVDSAMSSLFYFRSAYGLEDDTYYGSYDYIGYEEYEMCSERTR